MMMINATPPHTQAMMIIFVSLKPLDSVAVPATVGAAVVVVATVDGVYRTDENDDGSAERTSPPDRVTFKSPDLILVSSWETAASRLAVL